MPDIPVGTVNRLYTNQDNIFILLTRSIVYFYNSAVKRYQYANFRYMYLLITEQK